MLLAEQPAESVADRGSAVTPYGLGVRSQYRLGRPGHDPSQRRSRGASIVNCQPEFSGNGWLWLGEEIQPRNDCAPSLEPSGVKMLDQVSKDRRAAEPMKEDDFCCDPISSHDYLVDILRPRR
jgi:hypothetical protein